MATSLAVYKRFNRKRDPEDVVSLSIASRSLYTLLEEPSANGSAVIGVGVVGRCSVAIALIVLRSGCLVHMAEYASQSDVASHCIPLARESRSLTDSNSGYRLLLRPPPSSLVSSAVSESFLSSMVGFGNV